MTDEDYMWRCIALARAGATKAHPNPLVGAVVVARSRIIGEGWHHRYGEAHAEVRALERVRPSDRALLREATLYVTLEPCAHWGHTPPCADRIVHEGLRRVVCGCIDPYAKVSGRGVERMRAAGIEVTVGVLQQECEALNHHFFTMQQAGRPYITLKWAQTANGKLDEQDAQTGVHRQLTLSSPFTFQLVHKLRAHCTDIVVGRSTLETDHPQLTTRRWSGASPQRWLLSAHSATAPEGWRLASSPQALVQTLQQEQRQWLVVEGGSATLHAFMQLGLWDEARVEIVPQQVALGTSAPTFPSNAVLLSTELVDGHWMQLWAQRGTRGEGQLDGGTHYL